MNLQLKILFTIVFASMMFSAVCQEFHAPITSLTTKSNTLNYKLSGSQYYFFSSLEGSAYLNDDWVRGSVILENGDRYDSLLLKLNTFTEDLITFNERIGAVAIIDKFIVDEFTMDTDKSSENLFRKMYFDKYPKGEHYFNMLYEGKLKLLCWYYTFEKKTSTYKDVAGITRDSYYKLSPIYFIEFPDNTLVKVKSTRKSLINLFPEQKKRIRKLLRKNKIHFYSKNTSELARAVNLIETEFFSN